MKITGKITLITQVNKVITYFENYIKRFILENTRNYSFTSYLLELN